MAPPNKPATRRRGVSSSSKRDLALDDYLVALQKSFSRLSTRSNSKKVDRERKEKEGARSLVIGPVKFHMDVRIRLSEDGEHLLLDPEGNPLSLDGTLALDQELTDSRNDPSNANQGEP